MSYDYIKKENKSFEHNIKTAGTAGVIATGLDYLFLPKECIESAKYRILGEDTYIQDTTESIKKGITKNTQAKDVEKSMEIAKAKYPVIYNVGNEVIKNFAKTFMTVACCVFAGNIIVDKIRKN